MTKAQSKQTWALTLFCMGVFMAAIMDIVPDQNV